MQIKVIRFISKPKKLFFFRVLACGLKDLFKVNCAKKKKIKNMARARPKSPILFTINALIAALLAVSFLYQNPINKYEHNPTPSHPKKVVKNYPKRLKLALKK